MLALLAETQRTLLDAGVESVALKGPPLALRLYGTPIVRPIGDLDLFIPLEQRQAAGDALHAAGWLHQEGNATSDVEVLRRADGDETRWLDLLSKIPKHLAREATPLPQSEIAVFDGHEVRAHAGPGVPVHLAVHLAKHEFPPLLWFLDFAAAWEALTLSERAEAEKTAGRMEVHRYLEWARDRTQAVHRAAAGDASALELLGFSATGRSQPRQWRRELVLAGSVRGGVRLIFRWLLPESARSPTAFARMVIHRLRHPERWVNDRQAFQPSHREAAASRAEVSANPVSFRALSVDNEDFIDLVQMALNECDSVWITARGSSMLPTIQGGEMVRLRRVAGPVKVGDIVLHRSVSRGFMLHRIHSIRGETLQSIGDNLVKGDNAVGINAVIAVADAKRVGGQVVRLRSGRIISWMFAIRRWKRRLAIALLRQRTSP